MLSFAFCPCKKRLAPHAMKCTVTLQSEKPYTRSCPTVVARMQLLVKLKQAVRYYH